MNSPAYFIFKSYAQGGTNMIPVEEIFVALNYVRKHAHSLLIHKTNLRRQAFKVVLYAF